MFDTVNSEDCILISYVLYLFINYYTFLRLELHISEVCAAGAWTREVH